MELSLRNEKISRHISKLSHNRHFSESNISNEDHENSLRLINVGSKNIILKDTHRSEINDNSKRKLNKLQ